jgi:hypothetical protein
MKIYKAVILIVAIIGVIVAVLAWLFPQNETSPKVTPFVIKNSELKDSLSEEKEIIESQNVDAINLENPETKTFKLDIPPSPRKLSVKMILTSLNRTSSDSYKITFIEENMQNMQNTITLSELNLMLDLMSADSYKTELTKLLSQKINEGYTNRDYDKFTKQFSSDSYRNEATSILLQR